MKYNNKAYPFNVHPDKVHRCPKCGATIVTEECLACKTNESLKNKRQFSQGFSVDLEGEDYVRYLEVRRSHGLPIEEPC